MSIDKTIVTGTFRAAIAVLLGLSALQVHSQTAGNNAVYNSGTTITGSSAFVDLVGATTTGDICARINSVLSATGFKAGTVVDARGFGAGTSQTCATNPFSGITTPSTVLLPPGTIVISATWILPDQTQIIGAGRTNTTIAVAVSFSPTVMIEMGSSTVCPSGGCTGVGISDLRIDGQGANENGLDVTGIQNENSQAGSYVSHVTFHYVETTALDVETSGANDSGPYTDLTPSAGNANCTDGCAPTATTACVKIVNTHTRGIHGITCTGNAQLVGGVPSGMRGGIYLDGDANTIEDGHFEGVQNAVVVGDAEPASGNLLLNLSGATGAGTQFNVVLICNSTNTSPCTTSGSVSDLAIFQVETYTTGYNTIVDMINSTTLGNSSGDASVGMYVIGEALKNGSTAYGYSRFSTATSIPTWGAGGTSPSPTSCTPNGAIFSNTSGSSLATTIYVCVAGTWTGAS
jgi:Pectate lyase superfamily protein